MRTSLEVAILFKQFLELSQPLPVKYSYSKRVAVSSDSFISYMILSSPVKKSLGNNLLSESITFQVTVQTKTAKENMIYSEMIKLATEGTGVRYVSESPVTTPSTKSRCINSMIFSFYNKLSSPYSFTPLDATRLLQRTASIYNIVLSNSGIGFQFPLNDIDFDTDEVYDIEKIKAIKQTYLDKLLVETVANSRESISRTAVQQAELVKRFLETVQPLKVLYGYGRGIQTDAAVITYQDMGSSNVRNGIGNQLISEKRIFVVTVQTKTAKENMFYSDIIKLGTQGTDIEYLSDSLRKDTLVEDGYINTIMLSVFNNINAIKNLYSADEVRQELQYIADRYIFVTSIYRESLETSFIDEMTVPELEDRFYTYDELLSMKQMYLDKLLFATTKY